MRLGLDPEPWGLAGILYDLDYEVTEKSPEHHTTETVKILREKGIVELVIHAVQAHADKVPCETPLDWAIYSVDPLTGLIIAVTLMHPDKKIKSIEPDRMSFAQRGDVFYAGFGEEVVFEDVADLEEHVVPGCRRNSRRWRPG